MTSTYADTLTVMRQFLGKSDGKDKLCATIQYACLFVCAGEPGNIKKIQASITAARKVFRILKPLETLVPLILKPGFDDAASTLLQLIDKIKILCTASYFTFDHVAWLGNVGLVSDPHILKRCQKISLCSWFAGSCCTIVRQCSELTSLIQSMREAKQDRDRLGTLRTQLQSAIITLIHASLLALLALGLLQYAPIGMRSCGLIGTMASALNMYMLFPAPVEKDKEKKA